MDVQRIVEVWNPVGETVGTGYLISDTLVLTAYHNVHPGGSVEVRPLAFSDRSVKQVAASPGWMLADVLWPDQQPELSGDVHADAALLKIADPAWQPPSGASVRWGRLPQPSASAGRIDCIAVGFPRSESKTNGRDTKQISGHVETFTGLKSGLITVYVNAVANPSVPDATSRWSGASGAALFCGDLLVGVLTDDRRRDYLADQLVAVPVTSLTRLPGFMAALGTVGVSPCLEDVGASTGSYSSLYSVEPPPGLNNLPELPSRVFVGRNEILHELAAELTLDSQGVSRVIHGLGGVGKTTLALHYAHRYLGKYRLVWWVRGDTPDLISVDLAALARRLTGGNTDDTIAEAADWAIGWLQTNSSWLLIFDNVEHPGAVESLRGQLCHTGHLLLTTRYGVDWNSRTINLPILTDDDALHFLISFTGLIDVEDQFQARELAAELGNLPLALEQAGAFIAQSRFSVSEYRNLLQNYPAETTDASSGVNPERTMARIWQITLDALDSRTPLAVDILRTAAWYASTNIPRSLLAPLADNPVQYALALGRLAAYNLINLSGDAFGIHRLIQTIARTPDRKSVEPDRHRTPAAIDVALERAVRLIVDALPDNPETNVVGWPVLRIILPHIEHLVAVTDPIRDTEEISLILASATRYLRGQGQLNQAIAYGKRSFDAAIRLHGHDHPSSLTSCSNLAAAFRAAGDLDRAIPLYEQTLAQRERMLGTVHPETLASRNNLAGAFLAAGNLEQAIPLHEQAMRDSIRLLGGDHPDVFAARNNLAYAYQAAGDLNGAIPLYEQNLTDAMRVLGTDHPNTLAGRSNLAGVLRVAGEWGRAISLYEQTLSDSVRVLGADHPNTLAGRSNLAGSLWAAGDLNRAVPLYEQNLADTVRVLGADHAGALICRSNLAGVLRAAGDLDRAVSLYEQSLSDAIRVLGADHPGTLASQTNLAYAYRAVGNTDAAISLYEQTLNDSLRVLGDSHPDTLAARNSLASAYESIGNLDRAIALYERNFVDLSRALGSDHADTLTACNNLAYSYHAVGYLGRAVELYEQNLVDRTRTLGPDHPSTIIARNNLAHAYSEVGDLDRAVPMYERALSDSLRVLGPAHRLTHSIQEILAGERK